MLNQYVLSELMIEIKVTNVKACVCLSRCITFLYIRLMETIINEIQFQIRGGNLNLMLNTTFTYHTSFYF